MDISEIEYFLSNFDKNIISFTDIKLKKELFDNNNYFKLSSIIFFEITQGMWESCFDFWNEECAIILMNILAFKLNILVKLNDLFNSPFLCLIISDLINYK